jgi:hypothetical protein
MKHRASGMYYNPETTTWQAEGPLQRNTRPPPPPPPRRRASEGGAAAAAGLENVPQSMKARSATDVCAVCGGSQVGCAACDVPGSKDVVATPAAASAATKPAIAGATKAWNAFELGYGSLHPKYLEASRRTQPQVVTASKRARSPPVRVG